MFWLVLAFVALLIQIIDAINSTDADTAISMVLVSVHH